VTVNWSKRIAWATSALIILFGLIGHGPSTYRVAILFLGPALWGVYFIRESWQIELWQFGMFATALLLHDLGAFGMYGHFYYGLEFDTYVHFYFGMVGAFIVAPALRFNFGLRGWKLWLGTVLIIMGIGALHELLEFASTMLLGDKGMLKLNDPDKFDTQKDLGNNFDGCLLALAIYSIARFLSARTRRNPEFDLRVSERPERA
jgi:hypothetical protein